MEKVVKLKTIKLQTQEFIFIHRKANYELVCVYGLPSIKSRYDDSSVSKNCLHYFCLSEGLVPERVE